MYYGNSGLGETYEVKLPVVGKTTLEVPVSQMTDDALRAATESFPRYLPTYYQQMLPYINEQKVAIMNDIEQWTPGLLDMLIEQQVQPAVDNVIDTALAKVENIRDSAALALLGMTGAIIIAVGTAAWWIDHREVNRDRK
jgi:hypothetical protein